MFLLRTSDSRMGWPGAGTEVLQLHSFRFLKDRAQPGFLEIDTGLSLSSTAPGTSSVKAEAGWSFSFKDALPLGPWPGLLAQLPLQPSPPLQCLPAVLGPLALLDADGPGRLQAETLEKSPLLSSQKTRMIF